MSWPIKRGDREPAFAGQLLVNGRPVDLTGRTVRFLMKHATTGELKVNASATIDNPIEGRVSYAWGPTDTDTVGIYRAEWEVTSAGRPRTFPARGYLFIEVVEDLG
jgi:BppU N-terminal domain